MPRELPIPPESNEPIDPHAAGDSSIPETPATEPETPVEQEPLRESVETVGELLDAWKAEYDQTDDGERKRELAYRLVKMAEALSASGLNAVDVTIRESEPGVLGFYVPATGEIAMTPAGLDLPAEHFKDVLVHESIHAEGISDEGLTQRETERRVHGAMSGIYPDERAETVETFKKMDFESVLEAYDFKNPQELIELYLEVEWHDARRDKWQDELGQRQEIASVEGRQELLDHELKDWVDRLEENFNKAAPRLFLKAKESGFDFAKTHEKIFAATIAESLTSAP